MTTESLFRGEPYRAACDARVRRADAAGIVLDRTVFYPAGGGQPGDSGVLVMADGTRAVVVDTIKEEDGGILHLVAEGAPLPTVGAEVTAEIDWPRRHRHMRMHTALHLLCSLIDAPVTGGQVAADKGRLDFALAESPDKPTLTEALNRLVAEDHLVAESWIDDADLDANPDLVRTLSVQPPRGSGRVRLIRVAGVDLQPCGGTHVKSTAEIGRLKIGKIENKGRQNRRVNILFDD